MINNRYYIVCNKHIGMFGQNWLLFWRDNESGYTHDIRKAGIYNGTERKEYPIANTFDEYIKYRDNKEDNFYLNIDVIKNKFKEFHLIEIQ